MRCRILEERLEIAVKYCGQEHQLDVDTLVVSLLHLSEMLKIAANKEGCPGVRVTIEAPSRGSFKVIASIMALPEWQQLFGNPSSTLLTLSAAVGIVTNAMQLKKMLKGKKPDHVKEKDGKTVIASDQAQVTVTSNTYNLYSGHPDFNSHLEKVFEKLSEDPQVEAFNLDAGKAGSFYADGREFPELAKGNEILEEEEIKDIQENVQLSILKMVFQRNRKWDFIMSGIKISALIRDESFWHKAEQRQVLFGIGDVLVADLEVAKVFDKEAKCYLNTSYKVIRVIDYKSPPKQEQLSLF